MHHSPLMKVIFLDRDGVINKFPGLGGYVTRIKDFHFLPGSLAAIKTLTKQGYAIFVISNQAGVSRGIYTQKKLAQITAHMLRRISKAGGRIKKIFYCIHTPDENCGCRKPKIGSIKKAFQMLRQPLTQAKKSFLIGDAQSDIEAGHKAGCKTILVLSGKDSRRDVRHWSLKPDFIAKNLLEATQIVTDENSNHSRLRRGRA